MLQEASSLCKDPSVLRRLTFAASNLHKDTPKYWEIVTEFGFKQVSAGGSIEEVRVLMENIKFLDEGAVQPDSILQKELIEQNGFKDHPLGLILISNKDSCGVCGARLLLREDRPSFPVVYSEELGTVCGTHFRKYCSKHWKGCSFTQHYGFHQIGNDREIVYEDDCLDLPYFLSTHMTAFDTAFLSSLSAEILLGQISYKQKADIFNYLHGCDLAAKKGAKSLDEKDRYGYIPNTLL